MLSVIIACLDSIHKNWDTYTQEEKIEFLDVVDVISKIKPMEQ